MLSFGMFKWFLFLTSYIIFQQLLSPKVKAVVLDPANEFNVDRTLTKDDVQKLIRVSP